VLTLILPDMLELLIAESASKLNVEVVLWLLLTDLLKQKTRKGEYMPGMMCKVVLLVNTIYIVSTIYSFIFLTRVTKIQ